MGFWKSLRAVLAHPDIVHELEMERTTRQQPSQTLVDTEDQMEKAQIEIDRLEWKLACAYSRVDVYQAALRCLCPQSLSNEELKRIYEIIALEPDPYLALYLDAKKLTGIKLSTYFPYEESQGLFADAKGPDLLRYIIAAQFNAVTWESVPGTDCKKAVLGEVDTSTPEYLEFEWAMYAEELAWRGLGEVLPLQKEIHLPEHQKNEKKRGEAR